MKNYEKRIRQTLEYLNACRVVESVPVTNWKIRECAYKHDSPVPADGSLFEPFEGMWGTGADQHYYFFNRVSVPKAAGEVTLDGKINPAEWSDAAAIPVREMTGVSINRKQKINGAAHLKHDGKNLYVAFFCDAPSKRFAHTVRDGNLWEDDSFEFFLYSPVLYIRLMAIRLSISFEIFLSVTSAYRWVVFIPECPIILAMLSMGMPSEIKKVPKECLA